jgi:hypothetical protein
LPHVRLEYDLIKKEFELNASYVEFSYDTRNDSFQKSKHIPLGESILEQLRL